jgi:hypothetical protein
MKKLVTAAIVLLLSFNLSAQYKKAGFFEKEGRTYELGSQIYMMGEGNGNSIGYKIGFGRDKDGKRLFSNWEIAYIPSHEYSYTTLDENDAPVSVTGHSKSTWVYGANYNFHLLKNEAENKNKFQPFLGIGFNLLVSSGIKDETHFPDQFSYTKRYTSDGAFSFGLNGGVGCLVNFTPMLSLKVQGGYSHQFNYSESAGGDDKPFYLFDSFSFASLGVRLRIAND